MKKLLIGFVALLFASTSFAVIAPQCTAGNAVRGDADCSVSGAVDGVKQEQVDKAKDKAEQAKNRVKDAKNTFSSNHKRLVESN